VAAFLRKDGGWTDAFQKAWDKTERKTSLHGQNSFQLKNIDLYYGYYQDKPSEWDFTVPLNRVFGLNCRADETVNP